MDVDKMRKEDASAFISRWGRDRRLARDRLKSRKRANKVASDSAGSEGEQWGMLDGREDGPGRGEEGCRTVARGGGRSSGDTCEGFSRVGSGWRKASSPAWYNVMWMGTMGVWRELWMGWRRTHDWWFV